MGRSKASSSAVLYRSMGKLVPPSATAPIGERFTLDSASNMRPVSRARLFSTAVR